jgi:2-methylisocitrate lyase-like PEP mutase family enzyme
LQTLRQLIGGDELIVAPVALNPIMARLAEEAGFKAVYMSGGSLGWYKCVTEANITLPEMAQVAVDMRAACKLPIVLDAGGGWGDPMHIQRTIALSEAAGFAAIEIEDQLLPRRVEHHVGIEHLVPTEFMVEKVKAAVAARTDPDFIIWPAPMRGGSTASTKPCGGAKPSRRPAPIWCSCSRATRRRCAPSASAWPLP